MPLTFLCFFISAPPTCLAPTVSCAVNMRNKEGLNAEAYEEMAHLIAMLLIKLT